MYADSVCVTVRKGGREREKGWGGEGGRDNLYQYHYQLSVKCHNINNNNFCFNSVAKVKSVFSCLHVMIDC